MFPSNVFYGLLMVYSTLHNPKKAEVYKSLYNADNNVESAHYQNALKILADVYNVEHRDKKARIRISILISDVQYMASTRCNTPQWKVYHNRYENDKLSLYGPILKALTHGTGG